MTEDNITEIKNGLKCIPAYKLVSIEQEHVGKTYGKLTILEILGRHRIRKVVIVKCQCACGNLTVKLLSDVKRVHCKSCGCISRTGTKKHGEANSSGKHCTKEYATWSAIRITVFTHRKKWEARPGNLSGYNMRDDICDRWIDPDKGYINFLEDMGRKPEKSRLRKHVRSDKYDKDNCYWGIPK